ncbi:hypothetical protein F4556_002083 [Kitasatospora gansuensis]|uniref:Uncharacterized protein n=1 Tax=Kitasatospora gansuensis TaxID=258050 RepID=A0A7W7S9W1_9ACTN|nr:hypothetical protein [Kitasatospora gansuensis]MBB4946548.1 hypothetical protein [Kitasatospora gansuensis]
MEVSLTFGEGGSEDERADFAASLYRWLVAESELRGGAEVALRGGGMTPGQMGEGALEIVNVVIANGIALGSLVTAVAAWRGSRSRPPQVRLERNGVVVTLQDASPEEVERILRVWNDGAVAGGETEQR